jgi:plastocyanin domain-containing protein
MDRYIVTTFGIFLIAFIYWFFFGRKENVADAAEAVTIIVDGGYKPDVIKVHQGKSVHLSVIRKDTNSCLEEIIFPDYKIKTYLPLGKTVSITLPPPHPTHSGWHCAMNMYHGKIEVVS